MLQGMDIGSHYIAFGPVPSRRLGRSLGINNVPTKTCSYACIYCQVGETTDKCIEPRRFFAPAEIRDAVAGRLATLPGGVADVDYLSFVPDGEPTLDIELGSSIDALHDLGVPVAVFSNASLLPDHRVRQRLARADLVSLKIDSLEEDVWLGINRPHAKLTLKTILSGIERFAAEFSGTLITETMLLTGLNDSDESLDAISRFITLVKPRTAYLAVPTRPTTVRSAKAPDPRHLVRAYQCFAAQLPGVELLTGQETGAFHASGNPRTDLLAITAVHPMRETAVHQLLAQSGADWSLVENLLSERALLVVEHEGDRFYLRPVTSR